MVCLLCIGSEHLIFDFRALGHMTTLREAIIGCTVGYHRVASACQLPPALLSMHGTFMHCDRDSDRLMSAVMLRLDHNGDVSPLSGLSTLHRYCM